MFCLHGHQGLKMNRKRHVRIFVLSVSLNVHFWHYKNSTKRAYKQKYEKIE